MKTLTIKILEIIYLLNMCILVRTLQNLFPKINYRQSNYIFFGVRCLDFYVEASAQIIERFPLKSNPLSKFYFLNPEVVKSGSIQSIVDIAVLFPNIINDSNLQSLDTEWRLLINTKEIKSFSNKILPDI